MMNWAVRTFATWRGSPTIDPWLGITLLLNHKHLLINSKLSCSVQLPIFLSCSNLYNYKQHEYVELGACGIKAPTKSLKRSSTTFPLLSMTKLVIFHDHFRSQDSRNLSQEIHYSTILETIISVTIFERKLVWLNDFQWPFWNSCKKYFHRKRVTEQFWKRPYLWLHFKHELG